MSAIWHGIPLASAVVVRHTPKGGKTAHGRAAKGAIPCPKSGKALDYIARKGEYADRGDIEREATRDDDRLSRDRSEAERAIDYARRGAEFARKGAERQVDASLWGQEGPLDATEVAAEMRRAGGAFVDSAVSVKREYAATLGLSSKQDFERLLRATWARNVEQWGLVEDPADIRWCAAYHTDADMGLHCHVYTWSARGEIEPGATVPKVGTALGKEEIFKEAYRDIRQERDLRATYLRDLSIETLRRELGIEIPIERKESLERRAVRYGWPERIPDAPDLPQAAKERATDLLTELSMELAAGDGRLGRNFRAQAIARDLVELVEVESPVAAGLKAKRELYSDARCDLKGLAKDDREREALMRNDREDAKGRMSRAIARSMAPKDVAERELRPDLRPLDMRDRDGWGNVSFSHKLIEREDDRSIEVRMPMRPGEGRMVVELPIERAADINRGAAKLAAIELDAPYRCRVDGVKTEMKGLELVRRLGNADMPRIARMNPDDGQGPHRQAERSREQARERGAAHAFAPRSRMTAERVSAEWGTSLRDGREIAKAARRAEMLREVSPARSREAMKDAARLLVERSPRMREAVDRRAVALEAEGHDGREARSRASGKAVDVVYTALERESATTRGRETPIPIGAGACSMIGAAMEAAVAATAGEDSQARKRGSRIQPQREREREIERPM